MTASGRGDLARRRIDDLDQRLAAGLGVHRLREQLRRQVEIDAAGRPDTAARIARATPTPMSSRMQHAEGGLAERLGDRELVHLFVVALLQVDDLALASSR